MQHEESHDASVVARFEVLAAVRNTESGDRLVAAAIEYKDALCAFLGEWADEYDAGEAMQLPDAFPEIVEFWAASHRIPAAARNLDKLRNLSCVLATEPLGSEAA